MEGQDVCLDCEFHTEGRYYPKLCLVQLAFASELVVIDPQRVDLHALAPVLGSERTRKIVHDGRQDLPILARATGVSTIRSVFDTQIGAAFAGHGGSVGYGALVKEVCGVELDKSLQVSDWTRELSDAQIEYALDDVRYLARVATDLRARLEASGRLAWAEEACAESVTRALTKPDPEKLYRRVPSYARLTSAQLGILREVAKWRDRVAEAIDKPLTTVANDLALKSLALQPPRDARALEGVRGIGAGRSQPWARELLEAVARGEASPEEKSRAPSRERDAVAEGLASLLGLVRRVVAVREGIAAELLADASELRALADFHLDGRPAEARIGVLEGWRRALVGDLMLSALAGEITLRADPNAPSGIALVRS
jgi:ribonuclease D